MRSRFLAVLLVAMFAAPTGAAAATPRCSAPQLKLQFVFFQGATGHRLWTFAWRNNGATCTLHGFPKVVFLNKQGKPDTGTVAHSTGFPVKTVSVKHGKRAFFDFQYLDGGFCSDSRLAFRFVFTPPGDKLGSKFNPTGQNHGTVSFCPGSTEVFPVNSTQGP